MFVSHNKGDPYMKDVNMDAEVYVKILTKYLLPAVAAIRKKYWDVLFGRDYDVVIQHDGAPGHRADGIEEYLERLFLSVRGLFVRQPAKSPCTNMLDMCVFNSLASHVAQCDYADKEELVAAVHDAWRCLDPRILDRMWGTKCVLMRRLIDNKGKEIDSAHIGLTSAHLEGGHAELWRFVERYNAVAHAPEA